MKKYLIVIGNTFSEMLTYRFNFFVWRLRNVLQVLTAYFLWSAIIPEGTNIFDYSHSMIITYILFSSFFGAIVMSTRTQEIAENILNGDLSVFLLKPFNYFGYWVARDIGDKAMNIFFSIGEMALLFFLLKPTLFIQSNFFYLLLTVIAVMVAVALNFCINAILSMIGFWSQDIWAPRYLYFVLIGFFAGTLIPLDVFPPSISFVFQLLPFSFLSFFPVKVYLGQLSFEQIIFGFQIATVWLFIGFFSCVYIWRKGLKSYEAYGR